jgi:hypothetical protein
MSSARKFASLKKDFEEGEELNESPCVDGASEKKKKKKKKKKQPEDLSGSAAESLRTDKTSVRNVSEDSENRLESHSGPDEFKKKEVSQEPSQDTSVESSSQAGLSGSAKSQPSTTCTAGGIGKGKPNQQSKIKADPGKKKKKGAKKSGILPSEMGFTSSEPTNKEGTGSASEDDTAVVSKCLSEVEKSNVNDLERFSNETTLLSKDEKER